MAMISEISGFLVSGGLLFAASTLMSKDNGEEASVSSANAAEAEKLLNHTLTKLTEDSLVLAPVIGSEPYSLLSKELVKLGIESKYSTTRLGLEIDLSQLLLPLLCFSEERKLFSDMAKEGLVMSPGEANGIKIPGHFVVATPLAEDPKVVEQLITRLMKVIASRADKSTAAKTLLARYEMNRASSSAKRKETEEEAPEASTNKKSKKH